MDRQTFLSLLVSWIPFVVLIFVWIWLSRSLQSKKGWPLLRLADQQEAQLAELQRTNALLDRIATALERRADLKLARFDRRPVLVLGVFLAYLRCEGASGANVMTRASIVFLVAAALLPVTALAQVSGNPPVLINPPTTPVIPPPPVAPPPVPSVVTPLPSPTYGVPPGVTGSPSYGSGITPAYRYKQPTTYRKKKRRPRVSRY